MIIKKRFGPKSFVSYLGLKDVYILLDQNLGKNNKFLQGICINPYLLREELMNNSKQLLQDIQVHGKNFMVAPKI